jgi:predicted double-glycine peptidase
MVFKIIVFIIIYGFSFAHSQPLPAQNWKQSIRDKDIIKQSLDYSCGAAALATLIQHYFLKDTSEQEILELMGKGNERTTFSELQEVLPKLGFKSAGFEVEWRALVALKTPVIVYINHFDEGHFAVLRGIDDTHVWLADPSQGNTIYSKNNFLDLWRQSGEKGFFLAVLPLQTDTARSTSYFSLPPRHFGPLGINF